LPVPLDNMFAKTGRTVDIKAVVLDKDDCFAYPEKSEVYESYKVLFANSHVSFYRFCFLLTQVDRMSVID
jgi:phosphatidylglycerophosphatase GEP4